MKKQSLHILLGISLMTTLIYFIYTVIKSMQIANQIATMISISLLCLFVSVFVGSAFINKDKKSKYLLVASILITCYSTFNLLYDIGIIRLPNQGIVDNYYNKSLTEAIKWASKNNITLNQIYENSDSIDNYHIISQNVTPGTLTKKIKEMTITVSIGPDYGKEVTIPSMIGWTVDEVIKFVEDNHLNNIVIDFTMATNEKDTIISQVGSGSMKRNDYIYLVASLGNEEITEPVTMSDLTNKSTFYAVTWLKRNGLKYELAYDYSNKIMKDHVVKQSIAKDSNANPVSDIIKLTISKGGKITVPDLLNMTIEKVTQWIINNRLKISFTDQYDEKIKIGKIISANYKKGDIVEEDTLIMVVVSKGKLIMPSFDNVNSFIDWATKYNVPYQEDYQFNNDVDQGQIIKFSINNGETIKTGDTITVYISQGEPVTVPNFIGKSKTAITKECGNLGLSCTFVYGNYSETVAKDIATNQSKTSGSEVVKGTNISITLSKGILEKTNVPNLIGKTKAEASAACSTAGITCNFVYEASYSSTPLDQVKNQSIAAVTKVVKGSSMTVTLSKGPAKVYTIIIQETWVSPGNPATTKSTIQNKLTTACPGVTFNFEYRTVNTGIGNIHPDSPIKLGSNTFTQGQTYTIIIGN